MTFSESWWNCTCPPGQTTLSYRAGCVSFMATAKPYQLQLSSPNMFVHTHVHAHTHTQSPWKACFLCNKKGNSSSIAIHVVARVLAFCFFTENEKNIWDKHWRQCTLDVLLGTFWGVPCSPAWMILFPSLLSARCDHVHSSSL